MKQKATSGLLNEFCLRLKGKIPSGSGRAFANRAGIGYSTLHNYLSGVSSPTLENLVLLADALDVSVEWLATGKGESTSRADSGLSAAPSRLIKVPFIDHEGFLIMDTAFLRERLDVTDHLVALCVQTDVMEPTFGIGAVLLIDRSVKQLNENQLTVLKKGDNFLLKRVQVIANGYNLLSDNLKYPVLTISESELDNFDVLGEVKLTINSI